LPARFGGSSLDYQLAEEETPDGAVRLVLRASPSLGAIDEDELRTALLGTLAQDGVLAAYHAGIWLRAGTVVVRREAPLTTLGGKVLPFQLLRRRSPTRQP
jgi:hypothetical protein